MIHEGGKELAARGRKPGDQMHVNDLSVELLVEVFHCLGRRRHLNRACKTCKRWARVEAENRQALWRPLVLFYWPVDGISPAFAAMGVCWRARYQLLLETDRPTDTDFEQIVQVVWSKRFVGDVRARLAKINSQFTFFVTLRLGDTTILSKARLDFDEHMLCQTVEDPDAPTNDELVGMGTQITADAFAEADATALDFARYATVSKVWSVECFVQRADGKVARLLKFESERLWRDNLAEGNQHEYVRDEEAPPCEFFLTADGGSRGRMIRRGTTTPTIAIMLPRRGLFRLNASARKTVKTGCLTMCWT